MRERKRLVKNLIVILTAITVTLFIYWLWRIKHPRIQFSEPQINLYLHQENKTIDLKLEEYIKGTVAAEMPASFNIEALKAQAVAARTYTICKLLNGGQLSDDISNCQAYISSNAFQKSHSRTSQELWSKIEQAVDQTRGQILLYNNEPIDAMYHSTCGGRTVSAMEAWGRDVPYLQAVTCDYCKESKNYDCTEIIKYSDMDSKMIEIIGRNPVVQILKTTSGGRVTKIRINQKTVSGEDFRQLMNLPSTWIKVRTDAQGLIINSRGYGHGVGMCQYGADGMARAGKNYRQILDKYYQDVVLYKIDY